MLLATALISLARAVYPRIPSQPTWLRSDPTGFLVKPVNVTAAAIALHNFATGRDMATWTLRCPAGPISVSSATVQGGNQMILLGSFGPDRAPFVATQDLLADQKRPIEAQPAPRFEVHGGRGAGDWLGAAYVDAGKTLLFYDGPRIVKLSEPGGKQSGQWAFGQNFGQDLMPLQTEWCYLPRSGDLAVAEFQEDGMALDLSRCTGKTGIMTADFYIGKVGGHFRRIDGLVAGIAPTRDRRGFTIFLMNGRFQTYNVGRHGAFKAGKTGVILGLRRGIDAPEYPGASFGPLTGSFDQQTKCMYLLTPALDRLACISVLGSRPPSVAYIQIPRSDYSFWSINTFSGSNWISQRVDRSTVRWYEKARDGKPRFRFSAALPKDEDFVGLSNAPGVSAKRP